MTQGVGAEAANRSGARAPANTMVQSSKISGSGFCPARSAHSTRGGRLLCDCSHSRAGPRSEGPPTSAAGERSASFEPRVTASSRAFFSRSSTRALPSWPISRAISLGGARTEEGEVESIWKAKTPTRLLPPRRATVPERADCMEGSAAADPQSENSLTPPRSASLSSVAGAACCACSRSRAAREESAA